MDISLASFSSESIEAFKDVAGQECSFKEYVKSRGLFSSQYHLYLRSKEKEESACSSAIGVETQDFTVNGKKPGELNMKFLKKTQSAYSESDCSIVCRSMKNCFNITSDSPDASYEEYICPTLDGFLLTYLEKDNNVYLEETSEGDFQIFSSNNPAECEYLNSIVYGPGTIYGLNHDDLLIGCISTYHNQGAKYKWFRNNENFFEETNAAIVKVTLPGVYTVGVYINGNLCMSEEQCIVSNCKESQEPNSISNYVINQGEENKQLPVISLQQFSAQLPNESNVENSSLQDDNESSCGVSEEQCIVGSFLKSQEPNSINQGKENKQLPIKSIQQLSENMPSVSMTENSSLQDDNESSCGISEEQCIVGSFLKSQEPNSINQGKENKQLPIISIQQLSENMPSVSKTENSSLQDDNESSCGIGCTCLPKVDIKKIIFGEEIGRGNFGLVRKAEWLGTEVAVKEMLVKRMKVAKPMIYEELRIHSKVRHPNIIKLMAYGLESNKLYMVSELNDGKNLDEIIFGEEYEGKLLYEKKVEITKDILKAVSYLHNQTPKIIHRDIKPENVLVSSDLQRIRLCDLGVSKLRTMNTMATTALDVRIAQPGTPAYQAPEVLLNHKGGSEYSDIWSMGCTQLELFTETPLWRVADDLNPVSYIIVKMKDGKRPDSLELFVSMFGDKYNMVKMLNAALDYTIVNRPCALEMLKMLY